MTATAPHREAPEPSGSPTPGVETAPETRGDTRGAAASIVPDSDRLAWLSAASGAAWVWMRAVASIVRDWARPVARVVTVLGWILIGAGVVLLVTGLLLSWIEAVVLGGVTLAVVALAIPFVFGRTAYDVEVELNPRRVTVGDRALGTITVRNAGERRSLPTRMEFPVGRGRAEFGIPMLQPGQPHEELFAVPTSRRAVIPAGPARSIRGDQLGILRRTIRWTGVIDLFVHPKTIRVEPSAAGLLRDLEGVTTTRITDHDLAFHALRPYQPGDDRRHIHWKTTARTGTLMIRQFEETRRSQVTVVHTLDRDRYRDEQEFELGISVFASLVQQIQSEDLDIEAVTERGITPTRSIVAMLDETSRFEAVSSGAPAYRSYVAAATRPLASPTVVVLVGGSRLTPADLRQARALFSHEVAVTGFLCDTEARVGRRALGDLSLCTITDLRDLPRVLRGKGLV